MPWILAVAVVVTLAALVQVPLAWVAWIRRCDRQSMLTWSAGFAVAVAGTIVGGWIAAVVVLLVTCGIMMAGVRESNSA